MVSVFQNDGGVDTHSTRQTDLPALTSLWGAVGLKVEALVLADALDAVADH